MLIQGITKIAVAFYVNFKLWKEYSRVVIFGQSISQKSESKMVLFLLNGFKTRRLLHESKNRQYAYRW